MAKQNYPDNELPIINGHIYKYRNENLRVSANDRHLLRHRHILLCVIEEMAYFLVCSSQMDSRDEALKFEPNGTILDIIPDGEGVGNCLTKKTFINCNDIHPLPISILDDMYTDGTIEIVGKVSEKFYETIKTSLLFVEDEEQPDVLERMTWGVSFP